MVASAPPEIIHVHTPTPNIPNSILPVLLYRTILPPTEPISPKTIKETIEPNQWLYGGQFKTYLTHHYHSVTHECYVIFRGSSKLILGNKKGLGVNGGPSVKGVEVDVNVGDAIVLPAGVAHSSLTASPDYEYVGLYPAGSPKYDNNFCRADEEETSQKAHTARRVPIPQFDPVFGENGPLTHIWTEASNSNAN